MFASLRRLPGRVGRWPRLCAAGICLLLALAAALGARRGAAESTGDTVAVVVAARTLPAGHVLTRRDLAIAQWPARLRPSGATADTRHAVGERLAGPLAANEAVTTRRVLGADLTSGLGNGQVAIPVALDDAGVAQLVHPGDRVDVLAAPHPDSIDTGEPTSDSQLPVTVVARRALVLAVLDAADTVTGAGGTEIILAADRVAATRLTQLRMTQTFAVVGDPP